MDRLPNPFMEAGERSTFDPTELLTALESILQEVDIPAFIASPSESYLEALWEMAA